MENLRRGSVKEKERNTYIQSVPTDTYSLTIGDRFTVKICREFVFRDAVLILRARYFWLLIKFLFRTFLNDSCFFLVYFYLRKRKIYKVSTVFG